MKRLLNILAGLAIAAVALLGASIIYVTQFRPNIDVPENISFEYTPERIQRGKYLANEVMGCVGCHATRDFTKFAGPILEETKGSGGELWDEKMNFPGVMYAPNITPTGLRDWSDAEVFRAITSGVDKDGNALFPIMPYHQYGKLPREDIFAVIAYLRQIPASSKSYPERKLDFPLNFIVNLMPKEGTHHLGPDPEDLVRHGEYIITAAACYDCHTPFDGKKFDDGMAFAGGTEFTLATGGMVRSANLTPAVNTGIGTWTKEKFIDRFRAYADTSYTPRRIARGAFNTYMPWDYYATLKERDLEAIYTYLMSLDPIEHEVVKFTAPE